MFKIKKAALVLALVTTFISAGANAQSIDPLLFPKDKFTVETKIVKTSSGEKKVTYRSYMNLLYVANPVDKDYQSLNVSVPVKVNNIEIATANAPILFVIGVGAYMSVNNAKGNGFGGGMPGVGGPPPGAMRNKDAKNSTGGFPPGMPPMGNGGPNGNNVGSGKADLALAAGYVVVTPGCRGRDNKAADGTYYGKAPAAIVDLKAAVRYIRHNKGILPGNTDWIVSTGVSAGGALSALLGSSGNSALYEPYLKEIGAANAADNIYASADFCPITDLENADSAYEWMYGGLPVGTSGVVNQELSKQLKTLYTNYQASLNLQGKNGFGTITANNYDSYLLTYALIPSANKFLNNLTKDKREAYLAKNKWIIWKNNQAVFTFSDFLVHVGRMKGLPAFDDFKLNSGENGEFGNTTADARHFTDFSLQQATGNKNAVVEPELKKLVNLMNAMYFIEQKNAGCAQYWWLRKGTSDAHTSQTVLLNLATSLENWNKDVNYSLYWDAGHGADEDPEDFIAWMGKITGYHK